MENKPSGREARRLETRERVFSAAIAEYKQTGMAEADIAAIAVAAGVARGTFYFHFPTREHVLIELVRREEEQMAAELTKSFVEPHDLEFVLREVTRRVMGLEDHLGKALFSEVLGVHFSPTRPEEWAGIDEPADHPVISLLIAEIDQDRNRSKVHTDADPVQSASFFILGLYALLITSQKYTNFARSDLIDNFVATVIRGLEP